MANRADVKLALLSVVLTMDSSEDLQRVFLFSTALLRKRNHESAKQHLQRLTQETN